MRKGGEKKMRWLILLTAVVLAASSQVCAQCVVVNGDWATGDETGWTRWMAPWGTGNWAVTNNGPTPPEGTAFLNAGQAGSFGWYQMIDCCQGVAGTCTLTADWSGDVSAPGWAEVMFFCIDATASHDDIVARIDGGSAADIAFKKDGWGLNPPDVWDWECARLSPHGNGGVIDCCLPGQAAVIALKLGANPAAANVTCSWDNICVQSDCIPEPAGLIALFAGIGGMLIRRRR